MRIIIKPYCPKISHPHYISLLLQITPLHVILKDFYKDHVPLLMIYPVLAITSTPRKSLFFSNLPKGLSPLWDIQHIINLHYGYSQPNLPNHRQALLEHQELRWQVQDLLDRGFIRERLGHSTVPALLVPLKDGTWRMCIYCRAIIKSFFRFSYSFLNHYFFLLSFFIFFLNLFLLMRGVQDA